MPVLSWEQACVDGHFLSRSISTFVTVNVVDLIKSRTILVCRGFKSLLDLVNNTTHDSFELYYGLFMYNQVMHDPKAATLASDSLEPQANHVNQI